MGRLGHGGCCASSSTPTVATRLSPAAPLTPGPDSLDAGLSSADTFRALRNAPAGREETAETIVKGKRGGHFQGRHRLTEPNELPSEVGRT
eukprot:scaffold10840_cov72-Phaeocystis_antarctica.AAC.1